MVSLLVHGTVSWYRFWLPTTHCLGRVRASSGLRSAAYCWPPDSDLSLPSAAPSIHKSCRMLQVCCRMPHPTKHLHRTGIGASPARWHNVRPMPLSSVGCLCPSLSSCIRVCIPVCVRLSLRLCLPHVGMYNCVHLDGHVIATSTVAHHVLRTIEWMCRHA